MEILSIVDYVSISLIL